MTMTVSTQTRSDLIDGLMDVYVDWREESSAVQLAYERWAEGRAKDRALAFAAYRAALDREESASRLYSEQLSRVCSPHTDGDSTDHARSRKVSTASTRR
jgi:hypothetical protein